jgi:hypothetical protein
MAVTVAAAAIGYVLMREGARGLCTDIGSGAAHTLPQGVDLHLARLPGPVYPQDLQGEGGGRCVHVDALAPASPIR